MNQVFVLLGIESWKPVLAALVLPPVPLLLLVVAGAGLVAVRRVLGWIVVALAVVGLWACSTVVAGHWLQRTLLRVPPPLALERVQALRGETGGAIVVLGGGMEPLAPEYGMSSLSDASLQRLRYALWLARETGMPVAFSGGSGWAGVGGMSEAQVAARVAAQDFGRPLRWTEGESRDTRENATHVVPMLRRAGVRHIVLVTDGWHMPRARRHFEAAAAAGGMQVEPAPIGLARGTRRIVLDWLPSTEGFARVRQVLREAIGLSMGA